MRVFWLIFIAFGLLCAFVLLVEHSNHWFGPYGDYVWILLLLICPLLHIILHRNHAHGRPHYHHDDPRLNNEDKEDGHGRQ